jgi:transcriptional regulator with XRE-family HTH domain
MSARHYLRAWREARDLTLEEVAERIGILGEGRREAGDALNAPTSITHASLSRIERGLQPYNQVLLEMLAEIYRTDPASLLMRDPSDPDGLWSIHDQLRPVERVQLVEIAKTIKRTGTEG